MPPHFSYDSINKQLQRNLAEALKDYDLTSYQVEYFSNAKHYDSNKVAKYTRECNALRRAIHHLPLIIAALPEAASCTDHTLVSVPASEDFSCLLPRNYFRVLPVAAVTPAFGHDNNN